MHCASLALRTRKVILYESFFYAPCIHFHSLINCISVPASTYLSGARLTLGVNLIYPTKTPLLILSLSRPRHCHRISNRSPSTLSVRAPPPYQGSSLLVKEKASRSMFLGPKPATASLPRPAGCPPTKSGKWT